MNRISMVLGAVGFSFALASLYYRGIGSSILNAIWDHQLPTETKPEDRSTLDQDLEDIFDIFPWNNIRFIVEDYVKFDKEIDNTITFFKDHRKFIWDALNKIPHFRLFVFILKELEFHVEHLMSECERYANDLPEFSGTKEGRKTGGLSGLVNQLLITIPRERLHLVLCEKVWRSHNFRTLLLFLNSQQFLQLCKSIQTDSELQRHFYWANESGVEIIFASHLLVNFYVYLIQNIYIDNYIKKL